MDTVYIETSVVSHATAWPSKIPAIAVLQDQANRWLELEASKFRLVTSQFVIDEASRGDPDAAKRRLEVLENVGLLLPDPEVEAIADRIVSACMMAPESQIGCFTCSFCRARWCRISPDAELSSYCECCRTASTVSSPRRS